MIVNTETGEILDLSPLRKRPRQIPSKRRKSLSRADVQFIKQLGCAAGLVVVLMLLLKM